eukprot:scaffold77299_cov52-Phaeocystis_antarctica.AAC.2
MVGVLACALSSLEHAWPLSDECVTAFQRPPRAELLAPRRERAQEPALLPPALPKVPPRGCSRAASWGGRPSLQDEPHAPWRACSGR